ncbi:unnamed protein product [Prorocentrum cordatum]|uniref:Uncharacterized protein n=1 Tax=Prorocentrum cordatum TaxID=2364126 RepID=A0ABN9UQ12_9DINO|nr:unnamed protein product [Polarella glacialis]
MPGSLTPEACRRAEEIARGAFLAAHAASGLAARVTRVRLLRAAEGLLRAAVAVMRGPCAAPAAPAPGAAPRRRRRRRRRGRGNRAAGAAGSAVVGAAAESTNAEAGAAGGLVATAVLAVGGGRATARQRARPRARPAVDLPDADAPPADAREGPTAGPTSHFPVAAAAAVLGGRRLAARPILCQGDPRRNASSSCRLRWRCRGVPRTATLARRRSFSRSSRANWLPEGCDARGACV